MNGAAPKTPRPGDCVDRGARTLSGGPLIKARHRSRILPEFSSTIPPLLRKSNAVLGLEGPALGIALALLSMTVVSVVPVAAKLALDAGSNALTVVALRAAIAGALIAALIAVTGKGFRTRAPVLKWCAVAGLFNTVMSYGLIGSVAYIPVSLMVPIFFTHPVLLAGFEYWRGREGLSPRKLALAAVILLGLTIVLGPSLSTLHPFGVGLAAIAALGACGTILFSAKAQEGASSELVSLYMTTITVVILAIVTTLAGGWSVPRTAYGWIGVFGAGSGLAVGLLAFFAAFRYIGPIRATMINNLSPLLTVLFAVSLLGENLELWQWIGASLVVIALLLFELPQRR